MTRPRTHGSADGFADSMRRLTISAISDQDIDSGIGCLDRSMEVYRRHYSALQAARESLDDEALRIAEQMKNLGLEETDAYTNVSLSNGAWGNEVDYRTRIIYSQELKEVHARVAAAVRRKRK